MSEIKKPAPQMLAESWGVEGSAPYPMGEYLKGNNQIQANLIPELKTAINGTTIPKKILYIDMDGVLVDFDSAVAQLPDAVRKSHEGKLDEVHGIFSMMQPMHGAIDAFHRLCAKYDVYILSTASWGNPSAWSDKLNWVTKYLGDDVHKRLILTHNKHLNIGDYLIDDRLANGAGEFQGELIQFGTPNSPDWESILVRLGA